MKRSSRIKELVEHAVRSFHLEETWRLEEIKKVTVPLPYALALAEAAAILDAVNDRNYCGGRIVLVYERTQPLEARRCWHLRFEEGSA